MWYKEAKPSNSFSKNSSETTIATSDIDSLNFNIFHSEGDNLRREEI